MIFVRFHQRFWLPVVRIVNAKLSAIPGDPKHHELLGEFGLVRVFEKVDQPPPVPSAVCKHVLGISLPDVTEDLVHGYPAECPCRIQKKLFGEGTNGADGTDCVCVRAPLDPHTLTLGKPVARPVGGE